MWNFGYFDFFSKWRPFFREKLCLFVWQIFQKACFLVIWRLKGLTRIGFLLFSFLSFRKKNHLQQELSLDMLYTDVIVSTVEERTFVWRTLHGRDVNVSAVVERTFVGCTLHRCQCARSCGKRRYNNLHHSIFFGILGIKFSPNIDQKSDFLCTMLHDCIQYLWGRHICQYLSLLPVFPNGFPKSFLKSQGLMILTEKVISCMNFPR